MIAFATNRLRVGQAGEGDSARDRAEQTVGDFLKLSVWRQAHELTLSVYRETAEWPTHEQFGLISQARRAATSVPSNIAEGCGRNTDPELARFLRYSMGSATELSYLFLLAHDLGYRPTPRHGALETAIIDVRRMLSAFERRASRRAGRYPE